MPTYVAFGDWTRKGLETIQEGPQRLKESEAMFKQHGATLRDFFVLLGGPYNMMAVFDAKDDEVALRIALALGSRGTTHGTVCRAFPQLEYSRAVEQLS